MARAVFVSYVMLFSGPATFPFVVLEALFVAPSALRLRAEADFKKFRHHDGC